MVQSEWGAFCWIIGRIIRPFERRFPFSFAINFVHSAIGTETEEHLGLHRVRHKVTRMKTGS